MKFFFDRNLARFLALMTDIFDQENTIVHQDDDVRFQPTDTDPFIIKTVGGEDPKPVWVTADLTQRRDPVERAALRDCGMTAVFFKNLHHKGSADPQMQTLKVISVWPTLVDLVSRVKVPTVFEVPFGAIAKDSLRTKVIRIGAMRDVFRA